MKQTCKSPGCPNTFEASTGRGRPRVWCPEHASTKHATRRYREAPRALKSPCCPPRGYCPQHRNGGGTDKEHVAHRDVTMIWDVDGVKGEPALVCGWKKPRMNYAPRAQEEQVISDLIDVFGVASIWAGGRVIARAFGAEEEAA